MDVLNARILARRDTKENWNNHRNFIPLRGEIIIYTNKSQAEDNFGNIINIPGIKIGDGNAYLVDLPFVGDDVRKEVLQELNEHINDWNVHVSSSDRDFWNNKLNYDIDDDNLLFNRN